MVGVTVKYDNDDVIIKDELVASVEYDNDDVIIKDEVVGVDPSVFKRYYRTEDEEEGIDVEESDINVGSYNRLVADNFYIFDFVDYTKSRIFSCIFTCLCAYHVCFHAYLWLGLGEPCMNINRAPQCQSLHQG